MQHNQSIEYWLSSAERDLETAEILFINQRYDWCLFIGHLVLEKTLKAFFIKNKNESAPRIHNLVTLAEHTSLELTDEQKQLLMEINRFNIETRYPDYKQRFYNLCSKDFTEDYFIKIKDLFAWLQTQMQQ